MAAAPLSAAPSMAVPVAGGGGGAAAVVRPAPEVLGLLSPEGERLALGKVVKVRLVAATAVFD